MLKQSDFDRLTADRDRYREMLERVVNSTIPAGQDSTGQDMVKMRRALIELVRHILKNRAERDWPGYR